MTIVDRSRTRGEHRGSCQEKVAQSSDEGRTRKVARRRRKTHRSDERQENEDVDNGQHMISIAFVRIREHYEEMQEKKLGARRGERRKTERNESSSFLWSSFFSFSLSLSLDFDTISVLPWLSGQSCRLANGTDRPSHANLPSRHVT